MEKLRIGVSPCLGPTPDVGHRVCHERIRTAARVRRTGATTGAGAWGLVFAWCIAAVMAATAGDAPFTVTVRNLPTDQGVGRFALYDKPAAYEAKTPLLTGETAITNGVCVWRVPALPAGNYAVSFYQDGNANGVLDRNAIGMPRELLAFSNNTRPRLGPPRYARMQVVHGSTPHEERLEAFSALGRRGRFGLGVRDHREPEPV